MATRRTSVIGSSSNVQSPQADADPGSGTAKTTVTRSQETKTAIKTTDTEKVKRDKDVNYGHVDAITGQVGGGASKVKSNKT